MAKRQSFDESTKGAARGGGESGGGSKGNTIKVVVLVVALIGAGALLAWHFDLIGGKEAPPAKLEDSKDPDVQKALEKSKEIDKEIKKINRPPSGS